MSEKDKQRKNRWSDAPQYSQPRGSMQPIVKVPPPILPNLPVIS